MEESTGVFDGMDLKPTINDLFWKEKTQRMINDCGSVTQLREIASLLLTVATQRQGKAVRKRNVQVPEQGAGL